jgi:thiazole/oxazole-forming peptide maturase SagD family component
MNVAISCRDGDVSHATASLQRRLLSPLCGLVQGISFCVRNHFEPRAIAAGAELTGVHFLLNQPPPKPGFYHIGGGGFFLEESSIRALAESIERYSQFVSWVSGRHAVVMASYDDLRARKERVIGPDSLRFFSDDQYQRVGFPYEPFDEQMPVGWVKSPSLLDDSSIWVPAQLVLVGYLPNPTRGEKRILSAMTTGTATHTIPEQALRNALLELIQIDSAMGHWYSSASASEIMLDERTAAVGEIIRKHFSRYGGVPRFYWLPNADLPGMTVACVIRDPRGDVPALAVGLGSDLRLPDAMYKALLEAIGVAQLAKMTLVFPTNGSDAEAPNESEPGQILDLDRNVGFYAQAGHGSYFDSKFSSRSPIPASDLPADSTSDPLEEVRLLVDGFRATKKELVYLDLTTSDIKELRFIAVRVWSPDTLSLCLPSAPPLRHPRFQAYGGLCHEKPHPYP